MCDKLVERFSLYQMILAVIAAAASLYLAYVLLIYGTLSGYFDHVEPSVSIAGWTLLKGKPLYLNNQLRDHTAIAYGPLIYLLQAWTFGSFWASLSISKLPSLFAVVGGLILFFIHARRFGAIYAFVGAIFFVAFLLVFAPISFWNRPDPILIFLVALAVFAKNLNTQLFGHRTPLVLIGLCIGLSVNLKIHSFLYFLPIVFDIGAWRNYRHMLVIVLISWVVFLLPFVLNNISLSNYAYGLLNHVSDRNFSHTLFLSSLKKSVYFLIPGLLLGGLFLRGRASLYVRETVYFAVLVLCITVLLYPASLMGAGAHHLLPLFPITLDLILRLLSGYSGMPRIQKILFALLPLIVLVVSLPVQRRLMRNIDKIANEKVVVEIGEIIELYKNDSIEMGYGDSFATYHYAFYKPLLVFAGKNVTVDAQVVMDAHLDGRNITSGFLSDLRSCRTDHWLIPKGDRPFLLRSYYDNSLLFKGAEEVFKKSYALSASLDYFDIWSCRI